MTLLLDPDGPLLPCEPVSFVIDPALADVVEVERDGITPAGPTSGPNRYTLHVPTETTRLSLGQPSPRWKTDKGITGYTDSHVHFETKLSDKTIVSLGTSATVSSIKGFLGKPPVSTNGYAMVTEKNAWHEAKLQHVLLSVTGDMSLRTDEAGKRAVVQADEGKVDLIGGQQVNVSGGGVSIAAGELELEKKGYAEAWEATRPHSSAAPAVQKVAAIVGVLSAAVDLISNKVRLKYGAGDFAGAPAEWTDRNKWKVNGVIFGAAMASAIKLFTAPTSPEKCVKLAADDIIGGMAGNEVSIFGLMTAGLGAAGWATVSAGVSSSLKGTVFAGVGGMYTSLKGYRKMEMGSDWGKVFTGAETEIALECGKSLNAKATSAFHVASPEGQALFGAGKVMWVGTPANKGWGLKLEEKELSMGRADVPKKVDSAKIKPENSVRIGASTIDLKTQYTTAKLDGDGSKLTLTAKDRNIHFKSKGGLTINGKNIRFK